MKQTAQQNLSAFTIIETLVVIVVLAVLISMLLPPRRVHSSLNRISCVNNLKEIGTAYRLWAENNGDLVPPQQIVKKGGWADLLTNADQGAICWTNYALMANDMGQSPKLVICPADERKYSFSFTNGFDNTHVSYFVGVSANDEFPRSTLGGDRNLGPGTIPSRDYGYSPKNGKGNDVAVPISGPVSWSLKMHSAANPAGSGNILLGDGSAQQASSVSLYQNWLRHATRATNWPAGHVPASPSIRLVFP
jgi:hypothetical protein